MLRSLKEIEGYEIGAVDGTLGSVEDVLFDDETWTVRYVVARAGSWLLGRRVLIGWPSLGLPEWSHRRLPVALTREQVEHAPGIEADRPVSRRQELEVFRHFGWAPYWGAGAAGGLPPAPAGAPVAEVAEAAASEDDVHLRSLDEVRGYDIQAQDGSAGVLDDLVADDDHWTIRFLVVSGRKWLPSRSVLLSADRVRDVRWSERAILVDLTKRQVEDGPTYDPSEPINRELEVRRYDFHGRPHADGG